MTENYKPSKKEVFNELGNQIKSGSNKALNFIKKTRNAFIHLQKPVYALPTFIRKKGWNTSGIDGNILGGVTGAFFAGAQITFYMGNACNSYFPDNELWLIPVVTNVASGVYEIGRGIYKKTERKLIEKHNKGLESEVTN